MDHHYERLKEIRSFLEKHSNPETDFNNAIEQFNPNYSKIDPKGLDDSIKAYNDRFERLKFLFLEQESKEKFLRLILEHPPKVISNDDISIVYEENSQLKEVLSQKDKETNALGDAIKGESLSYENLIEMTKEKLMAIEKLELEIKENNQVRESIEKQYGEKLTSTDPLLLELTNKIGGNAHLQIKTEDFHSLTRLDVKLSQISQRRSEISERITQLNQLKQEKLDRIRKDEQKRVGLLEVGNELDNQIQEIKHNNEEDSQNLRDTLIFEKNEKLLTMINKILEGLLIIENYTLIGNGISYNFKRFPDIPIFIQLNSDKTDLTIEKVICEEIPADKIKKLLKVTNLHDGDRLTKVTTALYATLTK
ncbi:hypothetical protein WICMUC_005289 [Wickerhamomyces mucosus]|uniref:Kinetochore protein Sos7 coiled-coil domain-containing protein n=1 Tax=Wickerhamomyces mucosus TaxID=1378264 RepID=A0A9P8P9A3_9ASCO|nr:hypothetical protein WICMUC_005289 [Wickerhamomyces mucosus]